jgi:hypothetical protein
MEGGPSFDETLLAGEQDGRVVFRVTQAGLRVGKRAIPRKALREAWLAPRADGTAVVRVDVRRRRSVDLAVANVEQARGVLRALGFDVSQRAIHFALRAPVFGVTSRLEDAWLLVGSVGWSLLLAYGAHWVVTLVWMAITGLVGTSARARVGTDGVVITRLGWPARFLAYEHFRSVEPLSGSLRGAKILLRDGRQLGLRVRGGRAYDDRANALVERIREAMAEHARGTTDATATVLARRDRPLPEWLGDLRALGAGAIPDLRTAPVPAAHLWRVVESHAASPEARAAAAVALGAQQLDDAGKRRLRVAVDAVADERLRVAVSAVAEGDDASIEAALDDVAPRRDHTRA